ncbi:MAG: hypothetical protein D6815_04480 [Candidatus Dadabacteria bacterium]|nr:MAG: hypothetical protein D6815_04480 [Candidatus Dadabacteria bacterium]
MDPGGTQSEAGPPEQGAAFRAEQPPLRALEVVPSPVPGGGVAAILDPRSFPAVVARPGPDGAVTVECVPGGAAPSERAEADGGGER